MTMQYVRDTYGVPARRGRRVMYVTGKEIVYGTITAADHHVIIRLDGETRTRRFHPHDPALRYLDPADDR